jgi:protein SCO1
VSRIVRGPAVPIAICLVLGALGGVGTALVTQPETARSAPFTPPRSAPPAYRLVDEAGKVRTPTDARGKVLMVTFIFTQCRSACPRIAAEIRDAMRGAGPGVELHAISVDPENDTPEAARAWIRKIGLPAETSHVLAGDPDALAAVWERYGIVPISQDGKRAVRGAADAEGVAADAANPAEAALDPYPAVDDGFYRGRLRHGGYLDYEHSAYVLLIDRRGRQRVGFPFEQATSATLLHDIRLLQAETAR